ncbi:MAG: CBS and ACT domain-containing protein [Anaerolineae bacterium]
MFVRDCMTPKPITVRPESDPRAGLMLIKSGRFRHLPVVDGEDNLVGIVDRNDLETFLAQAGSPGIQKRQHRVDQAMTREVVTVSPDCPLEEAASLMVAHKIGSLPVLEEGRVVGIVTETDLFKQLAAVLGGGSDSLRLTVQVADAPGQLAELAGRISRVGGNISSVVAYPAGQAGRLNITLRVEQATHETVLGAVEDLPQLQVIHAWGGGCE